MKKIITVALALVLICSNAYCVDWTDTPNFATDPQYGGNNGYNSGSSLTRETSQGGESQRYVNAQGYQVGPTIHIPQSERDQRIEFGR